MNICVIPARGGSKRIPRKNIKEFKVFNIDSQNEHNGDIVLNSDIVIWGRIN